MNELQSKIKKLPAMDILTSDIAPLALGASLATYFLPGLTSSLVCYAVWAYTGLYLLGQFHDKLYTKVKPIPPTSDNYALVTGASYGMGLEMAAELAKKGYPLVLVARSEDKLEENAKQLRQTYNVDVKVVTADLSDADAAVLKIATFLDTERINVSILVNDAGSGYTKLFHESEPDRIRDMVNLNVVSLTMLTRALVPAMIRQGYGRILNVSSVAAYGPAPLQCIYHATKAFVSSFSLGLRVELQSTGVTVTTLEPGATLTNFFDNAKSTKSRALQYTSPVAQLQLPGSVVAKLGIEAMLEGKRRVVTGRFYKVYHYLAGIMPTQLHSLMLKYQWQAPTATESSAVGA